MTISGLRGICSSSLSTGQKNIPMILCIFHGSGGCLFIQKSIGGPITGYHRRLDTVDMARARRQLRWNSTLWPVWKTESVLRCGGGICVFWNGRWILYWLILLKFFKGCIPQFFMACLCDLLMQPNGWVATSSPQALYLRRFWKGDDLCSPDLSRSMSILIPQLLCF